MKASLFNRLYSYRQRENKNNRENFLIEIFAFCLEKDQELFVAFLGVLGLEVGSVNRCRVSTQSSYEGFGRPDLEIFINDQYHILIECKVDSEEGYKQLERYDQILSEVGSENRLLIYLTKYISKSEFVGKNKFKAIRWNDILDLLQNSEEPCLNEFEKYLKEEGMEVGYFGLICATHFGLSVPGISVQTVPLFTVQFVPYSFDISNPVSV